MDWPLPLFDNRVEKEPCYHCFNIAMILYNMTGNSICDFATTCFREKEAIQDEAARQLPRCRPARHLSHPPP